MENDTGIITLVRRTLMCQASSGAWDAPLPHISHVAFGDGGAGADGEPLRPDPAATALGNEVARYPIDGPPEYPEPTTARYRATIPEGELAGREISEAALVDINGNPHAIRTFYAKRKDGGVAFAFTFDDEF